MGSGSIDSAAAGAGEADIVLRQPGLLRGQAGGVAGAAGAQQRRLFVHDRDQRIQHAGGTAAEIGRREIVDGAQALGCGHHFGAP